MPDVRSGGRWARAGAPAAWALVGAGACWSVAGLEPNLVEEGLVLHVARRLAAGEHLYRDIVFFSGPLPFELLGALFRLFGAEIAVGRAAMAVFFGAATAATYTFARRSGAGALASAAAACVAATPLLLFPLFSMFYYTPLAFCLAALATDAASRGARSPGWALAAGVLIAAVALCKQTVGVALALGLLPALAVASPAGQRARRVAAAASGGLGLALLTLAFYGLRGDLSHLWSCLVTVPLSLGDQYRAPFPNLWPPGVLAPELLPNKAIYFSNLYFLRHGVFSRMDRGFVLASQLLYALPLLLLAATLLARAWRRLPAALALSAAWLLAMTVNLFPRSDWGHLVLALPVAAVHAVLLLGLATGLARGRRGWGAALACVAVTALAVNAARVGFWVHDVSGPPLWGPRVPLRPVSLLYRLPAVPRVIHYLRQRVEPGEPIFVARAEPLLYFATDTTNPTPFTGVLTALQEEQEEAILAALPRLRFVVMSDVDQPLWTYYSEELPRVQRYLERHFRVAPGFPHDYGSWIVVLERGPDRGATWLDLVDARAAARAWVRERPGEERETSGPAPRLVTRLNRRPLPVPLGPWGGGVDFEVTLPPEARFEAGIGYRSMVSFDDLHEHPRRTWMVLSVGREGAFEEVHRQRVSDGREAGRRWTPFAADLSAWAGQRVTLRLEVAPEAPVGTRDLAWWGSPRLLAGPGGLGPTPRKQ